MIHDALFFERHRSAEGGEPSASAAVPCVLSRARGRAYASLADCGQ